MTRSLKQFGRSLTLGTLVVGASTAMSLDASADNTKARAVVLKLAAGKGGYIGGYGGPGNEQPSSTYVVKNGKTYVVTVWMASDVSDMDGPWQLKCSSIELGATGPNVVANQVQITQYEESMMTPPPDGGMLKKPIRAANHPSIKSDGQNILVLYGSDKMVAARTQTYAMAIDHMCVIKVAPFRVSNNPDRNQGAPALDYHGGGMFTAGYLNAHGGGISMAMGFNMQEDANGNPSVSKTWETEVTKPANIGRPTITAVSPTRALFCSAKGDSRPAEEGVECSWIDSTNGHVIWQSIIAQSKPLDKEYYGQPSSGLLDYGRVAVEVLRSSGEGKKTNTKGSNLDYLFVVEPTDGGLQIKEVKKNIAHWATHSAVCTGQYGVIDPTTGTAPLQMGIFGASPTGVGPATLDIAGYDSTTGITFDPVANSWIVGFYGDAGKLSNMYGANPGKQGRDFMRCVGNVPNPGYHQPNGFMTDVKTLFISPHCGSDHLKDEPKNALFLGISPGASDKTETPTPPEEGSSASSTSTGSGTSGGNGGAGPQEDPGAPQAANGCACDVAGSEGQSPAFALALVGFGILVARRRRQDEMK